MKSAQAKKAVELPGYIAVAGEEPLPCIVWDESPSGASLFTRDAKLPDSFDLVVIGRGGLSQPCKVVRRTGNTLGVRFTRLIDRHA